MMEESSMNQHSIFEHVLGCDFVEAQANHGYVSESTYEAINEASGEGIFSKVIAFFKKLGEKIKGIIQNMINKIHAMFIKDGKQLVKKFETTIRKKMSNDTYDDKFKYKWSKIKVDKTAFVNPKENILDVELPSSIETKFYSGSSILDILSGIDTLKSNIESDTRSDKEKEKALQDEYERARDNDNHHFKTLTTDDLKDYKDAILTTYIKNSTDLESFDKDFDEMCFDDEEEEEGLDGGRLAEIKSFLSEEAKLLSNLDKEQRKTDKSIKEITDKAGKVQKEMERASGKAGYSEISNHARTVATNVISMGNACSACSSKIYAAWGAAIKKHYAQCRAVYIKAATYNKKTSKNEAALLEAVVEVSNYEVDQMMPEF